MKRHLPVTLKRAAAFIMSTLLALSQLVAPVMAMAEGTQVDLSLLPTVTVAYQTEAEVEEPSKLPVIPVPSGTQYVYWAMLPQEAFQFGATIEAVEGTDPAYSYSVVWQTPDQVREAMAVDGMSYTASIEMYQEGVLIGSWPLYLSSIEMPVNPEVTINIHYTVDGFSDVLPPDVKTFTPGDYTITAEREGDANELGYNVMEPKTVDVTVFEDGTASQYDVYFSLEQRQTEPEQPEPEQPEPEQPEETDPVETDPDEGGGNEGGNEGGDEDDEPDEPDVPDVPVTPTVTEINRYGMTNAVVNFRTETNTSSQKAFGDVRRDQYIWVYGTQTVNGEEWLSISYEGVNCYVMAQYVNVLSQEDSDRYQNATTGPVQVEVRYIDENQTVFYSETASCPTNAETPVYVNPNMAQGYTLQGDASVTVTVDAYGTADPAVVVFNFEKEKVAVYGDVTLRYVDTEGEALLDTQTQSLEPGAYDTAPYNRAAPDGYVYDHVSATQFVVDQNGNVEPATVDFVYSKLPVVGTVTFRYVDDGGAPLAQERSDSLGEGEYQSSMYAISTPAGYEYQGVSTDTFRITSAGVAEPEVVTFTYKLAEVVPESAQVTINYVNEEGQSVADAATRTLEPGTYSAAQFQITTPEGYQPLGPSAEQIVVSQQGVATPAGLTFTFQRVEAPLVTAEVTFRYLSTPGNRVLEEPITVELEAGEHDTSEFAAAPESYVLESVSADFVTVSEDGRANPSVVTFLYSEQQNAATVEVHYVNRFGEDLGDSPETRELTQTGTQTITPTASYVPSGYVLSSASQASYSVNVSDNYVATPNYITFTYYDSSVTGTLTINYIDSTTGSAITTETRTLTPGAQVVYPDDSVVNAGGNNYELNDASALSHNVQVDEQGNVSPSAVSFYYKPASVETYQGYAVTTTQTALRSATNTTDASIKQTLASGTLLYIGGQYTSGSTVWDSSQIVLGNTMGDNGWVLDSATRHITRTEAERLIEEYEEDNPDVSQPTQTSGFYMTRYNNVPMRVTHDAYAGVVVWLDIDEVVYVSGQVYGDVYDWHYASYEGTSRGYIRQDQLRQMTTAEVEAYLASQNTTQPTETNTGSPYDPYALSSYGYVTSSTVNFRATPNGAKLKTLNKYAFALILGTREVNGVTWYNVNQSGVTGWIHGSYFHQLNLTELTSFLGSTEYLQGLQTSTDSTTTGGTSGSTSGGSTGSATQGNISSVEDWNVGTWQNTGVTTQTSYAPFNPYATPSVTTSVAPSASVEPTATFVIGTMIPINYEDESRETQTDSAPWGIIGAAVVLIGGAGGVYAYALNQNKKRKAAASRAAASRKAGTAGKAAAGVAAAGTQSPYARRAVAAPPVVGSKQNDGDTPISPIAGGTSGVNNPFSTGSITGAADVNPYAKPIAPASPYTAADENPYAKPIVPGTTATPYGDTNYTGATPTVSGADIPPTPRVDGSASANPYVRPIGSISSPAATPGQAAPTPDASAPIDGVAKRRATRMQRYHAAEDGEGSEQE